MKERVCIVGGGAAGVALLWLLAKAQQRNRAAHQYEITLLHNDLLKDKNGVEQPGIPSLGGHSRSVPVEVNGKEYWIDLGVQMIAPEMYPNLMCMLKLPEFKGVRMDPVPLKVSCAFPPEYDGGPARYWGNFPPYQETSLYEQGSDDAKIFESMLKNQPMLPTSLQVLLDVQKGQFTDFDILLKYFLEPYLSIMNGYGAALLDQIYVPEAAFLFNKQYASFTAWSSEFARFRYGSMQWVQTMALDAVNRMPKGSVNILTGAEVTDVNPGPDGPSVVWTAAGNTRREVFDSVVLTTDMKLNGELLGGDDNPLKNFYAQYVGQEVWNLIPGYCYLHQDASILAPGKNLMSVDDPDFNYYLTMYGYDPKDEPDLPTPSNPIDPTPLNWVHGMWLPSFMWQQKINMRNAQGVSRHVDPLPTQQDTHIYFAGNNLTMDSEEGALVSAMAVSNYAFNVDAISIVMDKAGLFNGLFRKQAIVARAFNLAMYNMMFPFPKFDIAYLAKRLITGRR
jgi:hypothetical protein